MDTEKSRCFLILLSLIIFVFPYCTVSKKNEVSDFKEWSVESPLIWKDFKGTEHFSEFGAFTQWGISFKAIDSSKVKIWAYFFKRKSWYIIQDDYLLRHEQYHFNIAEIFARLIRKSVIDQKLNLKSSDFFDLVKRKMEECRQMQIDYDKGTKHDKDMDQQSKWENFIDAQLEKLKFYINPIIEF